MGEWCESGSSGTGMRSEIVYQRKWLIIVCYDVSCWYCHILGLHQAQSYLLQSNSYVLVRPQVVKKSCKK